MKQGRKQAINQGRNTQASTQASMQASMKASKKLDKDIYFEDEESEPCPVGACYYLTLFYKTLLILEESPDDSL